jgi:hypothetical protein
VGSTHGSKHGEVAVVVGADLKVDAGPGAAERSDELTDEYFALEGADPTDHGEPWVQIEHRLVGGGLEDQPFELHPHLFGAGWSRP